MAYMYEEEMAVGILSGLLSGIPSTVLSVAAYVLSALALYTIAQRRGLQKPWLAWIPVANVWLLGSLSDQYRYVAKGENKAKRKVLLTLNILMFVLTAMLVILVVVMVVSVLSSAMYGVREEEILADALGPALGILGLSLPLAGIAIACAIIRYMALYDVYKSLDPNNCVLFLVLSIVFSITEPFFLFFNRNKDEGMPPRRQEAACIPQPAAQNPWENKDYL